MNLKHFVKVIIILITDFSTVIPLTSCVFVPVGLSSLTRHFRQLILQMLQFIIYIVNVSRDLNFSDLCIYLYIFFY